MLTSRSRGERLLWPAARGGVVEQMAGYPRGIVSQLAASGSRNLYVDGGVTVQRFLRAGLIQRLIVTRVPVLIGEGVPLFGSLTYRRKATTAVW